LCQVIELRIPGTIATNDVIRSLNGNSSVFDRLSQERWSGGGEVGFTPLYLSISQDFNTLATKRRIKRVVKQKLPVRATYHELESECHALEPSFRIWRRHLLICHSGPLECNCNHMVESKCLGFLKPSFCMCIHITGFKLKLRFLIKLQPFDHNLLQFLISLSCTCLQFINIQIQLSNTTGLSEK